MQKGIASMNINECYQAMGADYEEVFGRLRNEKLIAKFVLKFPDDPSFSQLKNSLAEKNTKEAFRAAHTLKGVAQNLGFTPLYETAAAITEVLRTGNLPDGESMMNAVTKEYERTIAAIVRDLAICCNYRILFFIIGPMIIAIIIFTRSAGMNGITQTARAAWKV